LYLGPPPEEPEKERAGALFDAGHDYRKVIKKKGLMLNEP